LSEQGVYACPQGAESHYQGSSRVECDCE